MFRGSIVALVTPMKPSGEVDHIALRELTDWQISNKTDAIVVVGTTGESPTLSHDEKLQVIRTVVEQTASRIPVIAGTGTNCTHQTIELTREAMSLGIDACLLVTPYYNKPTQEGLYQHYKTIAENVPIPQILYNIPGRTGCDILPETVARLASIPNIVGIKEGRVEAAKMILEKCKNSLDVFSGDDITAVDIIRAGGKGVISVAANVIPDRLHQLCDDALEGNWEVAAKSHDALAPLFQKLFVESNPIPVKWMMEKMGKIASGIRLPLTRLSEKGQKELEEVLSQMGMWNQ